MAEFCLECYNKLNECKLTEKQATISEDDDLCEGCGEYKPVIVLPYRRNILLNLIDRIFWR